MVIKLLEMGIDAYGVDIDPGPIRNGSSLLMGRGEEPEKRLICIDADCRTPFADGFFQVVISDQVFEHVCNFKALAAELARITTHNSVGLHNFPAKWCVIEPHLFIPYVHWLPKNRIRHWYLRLLLDRIPVWNGLEKGSAAERTQVYFDYSVQKTYYRPLRMIVQTLKQQGFKVNIHATGRPGRRLKLCFPFLLLNNKLSSKFWTWQSAHFHEVELSTMR
jgi:SAM-dependent methyltransferase